MFYKYFKKYVKLTDGIQDNFARNILTSASIHYVKSFALKFFLKKMDGVANHLPSVWFEMIS